MTIILSTLIFSLLFNILMFIPAFIWKTDKLTDLSYAITFFAIIVFLLSQNPNNFFGLILSLMIIIWSIRLGGFLFIRIRKISKDKRFDGMREDFFRFLRFWLLQGLSVWIILIPAIFFFSESNINQNSISIFTIIGFLIWILGIVTESIADFQKYKFKQKPENTDKWIETGLWKKNRHPNYLGEILIWIGIYLYCLPFLSLTQNLVAIISPLFIFLLIRFISGVPLLEKSAEAKWGENSAYQEYKKRSGLLIPKI